MPTLKKASFLAIAGLMIMGVGAACATSKTIIFNLAAYDPIPGPLDQAEAAKVIQLFKEREAADSRTPVSEITFSDLKVWKKAHGDGYVICSSISWKTSSAPMIEAFSISTGPFPAFVRQPLYDEEAYNLVGCNTPNPATI